jgi:hypothetical protein
MARQGLVDEGGTAGAGDGDLGGAVGGGECDGFAGEGHVLRGAEGVGIADRVQFTFGTGVVGVEPVVVGGAVAMGAGVGAGVAAESGAVGRSEGGGCIGCTCGEARGRCRTVR